MPGARASSTPAASPQSPYAALKRDDQGNIVGTTDGSAVCWFPRRPSRFVAISDDGRKETILRCGFCPGCREFERRRLQKRLFEHYNQVIASSDAIELWLLVAHCPLELQSTLSRRLRRVREVEGMYRLDDDVVAFVMRERPRPKSWPTIARMRITCEIRRVRISRGRRAWSLLTVGLMRARSTWGDWRNRFYHRGLPAAEKLTWTVSTRRGMAKRHAGVGYDFRAWSEGITTYLPAQLQGFKLRKRAQAKQQLAELLEMTIDALSGKSRRPRPSAGASGGHDPRNSSSSRRGRVAAALSSLGGVTRREARPNQRVPDPNYNSGQGYRGSVHGEDWIAGWLERMLAKTTRGSP